MPESKERVGRGDLLDPLWVKTAADGTFHTSFTVSRNAGASAAVTAHYYGVTSAYTETGLGTLNIKNTATLTDFNAFPSPSRTATPSSRTGA